MVFHYFERDSDGHNPPGVTCSKTDELPAGDFEIDEFCWGPVSLWFIASQGFSADERQRAYEGLLKNDRLTRLANT